MSGASQDPLDTVLRAMCCPACGDALERADRTVRCVRGHAFDLARQGYLNLVVGRGGPATGDSAEMIAARERVQAAHVLDPVVEAVTTHAVMSGVVQPDGVVVDLAGGTGVYLASVLGRLPTARGICLDLSTPALRRAAHAHGRMAAVGADAWGRLPLRDSSVSVVLSVFGPRTGAEIGRVLAPGGAVVVAYPSDGHFAELRPALGLPAVGEAKPERLAQMLRGLELSATESVDRTVRVGRELAADLALMGPAGKTRSALELRAAAATLDDDTQVTVSVRVQVWRRPLG